MPCVCPPVGGQDGDELQITARRTSGCPGRAARACQRPGFSPRPLGGGRLPSWWTRLSEGVSTSACLPPSVAHTATPGPRCSPGFGQPPPDHGVQAGAEVTQRGPGSMACRPDRKTLRVPPAGACVLTLTRCDTRSPPRAASGSRGGRGSVWRLCASSRSRQKGGATWKQSMTTWRQGAGEMRGLSGKDPAVEHAERRLSRPNAPDSPRPVSLHRWRFLPAPRRRQLPVRRAGTSVPGDPGARAQWKSAVQVLQPARAVCPPSLPPGPGRLTRHAQRPQHCDSGLPRQSHPACRSSPWAVTVGLTSFVCRSQPGAGSKCAPARLR